MAIGDGWVDDSWVDAGWVTAPEPGGAWSVGAVAVVESYIPTWRPRRIAVWLILLLPLIY